MANVEVQIAYNVEMRFSKNITAVLSKVLKKFGKLVAIDENNFPHITILRTQSPSIVEEFGKCFDGLERTPIELDEFGFDVDRRLIMTISSKRLVEGLKKFQSEFCANFMYRNFLKDTFVQLDEAYWLGNWAPICKLADYVPENKEEAVEKIMTDDRVYWPVGYIDKVVLKQVSPVHRHIATHIL